MAHYCLCVHVNQFRLSGQIVYCRTPAQVFSLTKFAIFFPKLPSFKHLLICGVSNQKLTLLHYFINLASLNLKKLCTITFTLLLSERYLFFFLE